ncbi:hypothetical protein DL766_000610 [Monosporascus sp. MC13-8B]|uniref:Uncharacterized protein n=1 Tax=Monosporascus cannonballus TaxID=155416 RepID=A0ABY0GX67_9PEZI|nr:hypothetical protein DL762_009545 [Monosporascus cannonballus]RYO78499.1 hypothetical protein DL763_009624 [Monosporascus cannonballus]RYP38970.1 hypothetical protein DL766_000610 [Monosporascus sp. MC13-8B]
MHNCETTSTGVTLILTRLARQQPHKVPHHGHVWPSPPPAGDTRDTSSMVSGISADEATQAAAFCYKAVAQIISHSTRLQPTEAFLLRRGNGDSNGRSSHVAKLPTMARRYTVRDDGGQLVPL